MKTSQFERYRIQTNPQENRNQKKPQPKFDDTIKGIILNNHIKKQDAFEKVDNFDRISSQLLIPENLEIPTVETREEKKEGFDYKKALKPVLISTGAILGATALIAGAMKKYSVELATKDDIVRPGDLARNINILEEPHFAMYRALRDPNAKNIIGLIGVGLFTVVSLSAKTLVDSIKEIWIKKQSCDIEYNLQEGLIDVEAEAFSGKLNVVNTLLADTTKYFKNVLSEENPQQKTTNFKSFLTFKGEDNKTGNTQEDKDKIKAGIAIAAGIAGIVGLSFALFKNFQKTVKNLDTFTQKFEHQEIESKIANAVGTEDKASAIKQLVDIFKVINAKDETMQTNLSKIKDITQDEINNAMNEVKKAQIYAQAPEALGGISEKIQYYCYINEERGHLYNWILNPENKFNKYLFLSFSAISAAGYVMRQSADAIKNVIVNRENSKSELDLKRRLVETEINNFKTKKMSAIHPMVENFDYQRKQGKSKEELKELAENILIEIKNGPPYVYS